MDVKLILVGLIVLFIIGCLFFGIKNGFYDIDDYYGNGFVYQVGDCSSDGEYFFLNF